MTGPILPQPAASPFASARHAATGGPHPGKAAEAFEAIIVRQMLAAMRQARLSEDIFGSGASDNFREVADARLADTLAARRQFGIAALIDQQLGTADRSVP